MITDRLISACAANWTSSALSIYRIISLLLYEAIEDEMAEVCFVLYNAHSVPLVNIAPGKAFRRCCNKPVKVPLTLVHYEKYCTRAWSRG